MRVALTVDYPDGRTAHITAGPASILAYEDEHDEAIARAMGSGRNHWAAWLAWHATMRDRRSGREPGTPEAFEAWLDSVVDIDLDTGHGAADPEREGADTSGPTGAGPEDPSPG